MSSWVKNVYLLEESLQKSPLVWFLFQTFTEKGLFSTFPVSQEVYNWSFVNKWFFVIAHIDKVTQNEQYIIIIGWKNRNRKTKQSNK